MRTITITTYASMPGRFRVQTNDRRPMERDAQNAGEAAAVALNYANASNEGYVIVGHTAAMNLLPMQVRSRVV